MQSWVEELLTTGLPQVARVCLDRTVPALVDEDVRSAIPPLLDELQPTLVRREVVTAPATVGDDSPSDVSKGSHNRRRGRWSGDDLSRRGMSRRARAVRPPRCRVTRPLRILRKRTMSRSALHLASVQWPLTRRVGLFISYHFIVLQESRQKMALPYSPIRLAPAGQKTAWGASRQKRDSRIGRAEEAHLALKDAPQRVPKTPPRNKTEDVATGQRASTAADAMGDTAMTATDATRDTARTATDTIGDTAMIITTNATSDTAMPEEVVTPPMMTTLSRTNRVGATTGVAARATNVGSGEKILTWTATVAPEEKETAIAGAKTAGMPRGGIGNGCR